MFKPNLFFRASLAFRASLVAVFWMSAGAVALAQPSGRQTNAVRSPLGQNPVYGHTATESAASKSAPAKRNVAKSCAEFGPGFVRAEGSDTCIRIGGSMGIGVGGGSGRSGSLR